MEARPRLYQKTGGRIAEIPTVSGSGGDAVYTTDEQLIGAWNGAPLYRRAIENLVFPSLNTAGVPVYNLGLTNIILVHLRCCCKITRGEFYSLPYKGPTVRCFIGLKSGILYAYAQSSVFNGATSQIVVEYTKATE